MTSSESLGAAPVNDGFDRFTAAWDITKACNFACVHCISGAGRLWPVATVPTGEALRIVREIGCRFRRTSNTNSEQLRTVIPEKVERYFRKTSNTFCPSSGKGVRSTGNSVRS